MSKFLAKVAFPDFQSTTIQVSPEDTAHDVKQRVVSKHAGAEHYNVADYELAFEMVALADDLILSGAKFAQGGSTISLVFQKKFDGSFRTTKQPELARRGTLTRLVTGVKELLGSGVVGQQIEEWSSRKEKAALLLANPECTGEARKAAEAEVDLCRKQLADLISKAGSSIGPTHIAGYLVKQRTVPNLKWQKRFFTFNEGCMSYRDNPTDKPKMEVSLRAARVEQTSSYVYFEEQKYTRFVLQVESDLFELGALEEQVEHWVNVIRANIALVTPIEFEVGEHCTAPWSDGNYYPAVITAFGADKSVSIDFPDYGESWTCQRSELRKVAAEGEDKKADGPMGQREVVKKDSFLRMHKSGKWASKHFRLLGLGNVQSLQYFKDVASQKSLGSIPITGATVVECVNGGELYSFHVIEKDQPPYLLCAASETLRHEWLYAIAAIIKASSFGAMSWGLSLLVLYPPEELGKKELEAILDELEKSKEGTREELMSRVREIKKSGGLPAIDLVWNTVESTTKVSSHSRSESNNSFSSGTQKLKDHKEHVKKEGVLMKKGVVNTMLKSRYFKLIGAGNTQSLVYYKKKEDKAPLGVIPVCASTTLQWEAGVEFIITPEDKRAYALSASSEKEAKEWVTLIQSVIDATTPGAMSWSAALLVLYPPDDLTEKELVAILEEGGMTGNENLNKDQLICKVAIMQTLAQEEVTSPRTTVKPKGKDGTQSGTYSAESIPSKARPPPKIQETSETPKSRLPKDPTKTSPEASAPFRPPTGPTPAGPPVMGKLPPKPQAAGTPTNQSKSSTAIPSTIVSVAPPRPAPAAPPKVPQAPPRPPLASSAASASSSGSSPLLAPSTPTARPPPALPSEYKVGQVCFAPWSDGHYYACTILAVDGDEVQVNFDEYGEQGSASVAQLSRQKP